MGDAEKKEEKKKKTIKEKYSEDEELRQNLSGPVLPMTSPMKNTENFTNLLPMTGRSTWQSSISLLRVSLSSEHFSSFPRELPLISLRIRKPRTASSCTSEECSSWTTVRNSFLIILISLEELLILRIFL